MANETLASERCFTCIYGTKIGTTPYCDYILIKKVKRGCRAGDECTKYKYKKGQRKVRLEFEKRV